MIAVAARNIYINGRDYKNARDEYAYLRSLHAQALAGPGSGVAGGYNAGGTGMADADSTVAKTGTESGSASAKNGTESGSAGTKNGIESGDAGGGLAGKPGIYLKYKPGQTEEMSADNMPSGGAAERPADNEHSAVASDVAASATGIPAASNVTESNDDAALSNVNPDSAALSGVNPDYAGWIEISGAGIGYPVVRGADNEKYLHTTFSGEYNPSGAVFMDYRCAEGFYAPVCILYGHNMKDGSMFAPLARYLEPGFIAANPRVTVTTPGGDALTFIIFAARRVGAADEIYSLDFGSTPDADLMPGAPPGAKRFLLLSTCAKSNRDKDERLLVYSALSD